MDSSSPLEGSTRWNHDRRESLRKLSGKTAVKYRPGEVFLRSSSTHRFFFQDPSELLTTFATSVRRAGSGSGSHHGFSCARGKKGTCRWLATS